MTPASKIGGMPIWNLRPWLVAVFIFVFDFVMVNVASLRGGDFSWRGLWRFRSFAIGDSICLPLAAGFAADIFHHLPAPGQSAWYRQPWWTVVALFLAALYAYTFEGPAVHERFDDQGNIYHHGIVAVVFFLLIQALPGVIAGHRQWVLFALSLGFAFTHVVLGVTDQIRERKQLILEEAKWFFGKRSIDTA